MQRGILHALLHGRDDVCAAHAGDRSAKDDQHASNGKCAGGGSLGAPPAWRFQLHLSEAQGGIPELHPPGSLPPAHRPRLQCICRTYRSIVPDHGSGGALPHLRKARHDVPDDFGSLHAELPRSQYGELRQDRRREERRGPATEDGALRPGRRKHIQFPVAADGAVSIWYYFDHDTAGEHEQMILGTGAVGAPQTAGFNACSVFRNFPDLRDLERQGSIEDWQIITGLSRVYTPAPRLTRTSDFNTVISTRPLQSSDADAKVGGNFDIISNHEGSEGHGAPLHYNVRAGAVPRFHHLRRQGCDRRCEADDARRRGRGVHRNRGKQEPFVLRGQVLSV